MGPNGLICDPVIQYLDSFDGQSDFLNDVFNPANGKSSLSLSLSLSLI